MSHKTKSHPIAVKSFAGSVELVPPPPQFIEFINSQGLWCFPVEQLASFVLEDNPEPQVGKTPPAQRLTLVYPAAQVVLRGWRLELMLDPLMQGRIKRIHAEEHPGTPTIEEAWVSEIHVHPHENRAKQP